MKAHRRTADCGLRTTSLGTLLVRSPQSAVARAVFTLLLAGACQRAESPQPDTSATRAPVVSGARVAFARTTSQSEWHMPGGDYSNSRYSELAEITTENAGRLRVAWTFSTGVLRGHEGQPLVVDNTMYLVTPYPNVSYALDLATPGYPLKWKFRPENAQAAVGLACCDVVNRGAAYADGKIFYNLLDGHTVAVDVRSGNQVWRTRMGDLQRGET
ncbi:MAG: PQQ-dependent dehydrogenase, methanol/ethanol family, partial [Gemmatimonadaceae bacterium]